MIRLTVEREFEITTTNKGKIIAKKGDILTLKNKGAEYYYILKCNDTQIFSIWKRKNWVDFHCK